MALHTARVVGPLATRLQRPRTWSVECDLVRAAHRMAWSECERRESNPHPLRDQVLSLARLPFRHARDVNIFARDRVDVGDVQRVRLRPSPAVASGPKPSASANSATLAALYAASFAQACAPQRAMSWAAFAASSGSNAMMAQRQAFCASTFRFSSRTRAVSAGSTPGTSRVTYATSDDGNT